MQIRGKIYVLIDPITLIIKYIGQTTLALNKRLIGHLSQKSNDKRGTWIKSLKRRGLIPIIEELDSCDYEELNFWETHYIFLFRSWGFELKNSNFGGDCNPITEETRRKISASKKGKSYNRPNYRHSAETILKIKKSNTGKKRDPEVGIKISEKLLGNTFRRGSTHTEESKKKNSISKGGKPIEQYDLQNNYIKTYNHLFEVEYDGFLKNKVCACCRGRRNTHANYKWKYKTTVL